MLWSLWKDSSAGRRLEADGQDLGLPGRPEIERIESRKHVPHLGGEIEDPALILLRQMPEPGCEVRQVGGEGVGLLAAFGPHEGGIGTDHEDPLHSLLEPGEPRVVRPLVEKSDARTRPVERDLRSPAVVVLIEMSVPGLGVKIEERPAIIGQGFLAHAHPASIGDALDRQAVDVGAAIAFDLQLEALCTGGSDGPGRDSWDRRSRRS